MTLRSIEMQVALPRVNDVGQVQNQLSQKPLFDQALLAQKEALKSQEQLKRSNEVDKSSTLLVGEEDAERGARGQNRQPGARKRRSSEAGDKASIHPYKGHHIDLTL